jgi:DNA-binding response OmpR family regulator
MSSELDFPARKTVLLVETDWALGRLTARLLRPHEVLVAVSCGLALEVLARHPVDTVVFDPSAPGESGIDFLLTIRQMYSRLRVVIYTLSREIQKSGAFGLAHATLVKPASDRDLRAAILGHSDSREFKQIRVRDDEAAE